MIKDILNKEHKTSGDLVRLLSTEGDDRQLLLAFATQTKDEHVGRKVYFRGLIEFSNICAKDCYYCGIRKGNRNVERYDLSDEEILAAAKFAHENRYGSVVIQGGEIASAAFTERVENLCKEIKLLSDGSLGIIR